MRKFTIILSIFLFSLSITAFAEEESLEMKLLMTTPSGGAGGGGGGSLSSTTGNTNLATVSGGVTVGYPLNTMPGDGNLAVKGLVGIGTINPAEPLDVVGILRLRNADGSPSGIAIDPNSLNSPEIRFYRRAASGVGEERFTIRTHLDSTPADDLLIFDSSASNTLVLKGDGNVGIGTASPTRRLTVVGRGGYAAQGSASIGIENTSSNAKWQWFVDDAGNMELVDYAAAGGRERISFSQGNGPASNIEVDGSNGNVNIARLGGDVSIARLGNVGIGTNSPASKLTVIENRQGDTIATLSAQNTNRVGFAPWGPRSAIKGISYDNNVYGELGRARRNSSGMYVLSGVYGMAPTGVSINYYAYAGYFDGRVAVTDEIRAGRYQLGQAGVDTCQMVGFKRSDSALHWGRKTCPAGWNLLESGGRRWIWNGTSYNDSHVIFCCPP